MNIENVKMLTGWDEVVSAARTTINKPANGGEPIIEWKTKILLAEHSPIRNLTFTWTWVDLPSWISVHFVRHKIGIEHFVSTQRTDRTGVDRDKKPQDAPVTHKCVANAQAIINISRKRMCNKAHVETRRAWDLVSDKLFGVCIELWAVCVPECIHRGFCPEFKSCGFNWEEERKHWLNRVGKGVNYDLDSRWRR